MISRRAEQIRLKTQISRGRAVLLEARGGPDALGREERPFYREAAVPSWRSFPLISFPRRLILNF